MTLRLLRRHRERWRTQPKYIQFDKYGGVNLVLGNDDVIGIRCYSDNHSLMRNTGRWRRTTDCPSHICNLNQLLHLDNYRRSNITF
jgi:hypothetical protein